jgi:hypothetical protein
MTMPNQTTTLSPRSSENPTNSPHAPQCSFMGVGTRIWPPPVRISRAMGPSILPVRTRLRSHPIEGCPVHPKRASNIYNGVTGVQALDRLAALMGGKFERPPEPHAAPYKFCDSTISLPPRKAIFVADLNATSDGHGGTLTCMSLIWRIVNPRRRRARLM